MPLQETSGAASYDAYGGGVAAVPNYIEDVFSTYLYTGTGNASTNTIVNGIDLAGKGGIVWLKARNQAWNNWITTTATGVSNSLSSNLTDALTNIPTGGVSAFNATGFDVTGNNQLNSASGNFASWTFRKQPKFCDVVTYTGNGVSGRQIAHNLGSTPGCIIIKCTSTATVWAVYHRSLGGTNFLRLNTTDASVANSTFWNNTDPTSTVFTVGNAQGTNQNTLTYVAYLFAHNAGGFGLTGTDNVISCGSWTENGTVQDINLGFEPQLLIVKNVSSASNWFMFDNMRGWSAFNGPCQSLVPNLSQAEVPLTGFVNPTATGFRAAPYDGSGQTQIYIAIRRGPMKVPTDATKVFVPVARTGNAGTATVTAGFPVDTAIIQDRQNPYGAQWFDRLRGAPRLLWSWTTAAEQTAYPNTLTGFDNQTGVYLGFDSYVNTLDQYINYFLRRAPGFFDEVCYTGTGVAKTESHNLGVAPELMIVKSRAGTGRDWVVYAASQGNNFFCSLNDGAFQGSSSTMWNDTTPTSSVFTVGTNLRTNNSGQTYVAYLFASCPGVSKVFSFTGNGTTQTINCGFTGGARFVLLKASSATGGWYVYDTARGMTTLTDPYLFLNSTAAEVATLGSVTTVTTGFAVNEAITTGVNTNGVTYVGIAIA